MPKQHTPARQSLSARLEDLLNRYERTESLQIAVSPDDFLTLIDEHANDAPETAKRLASKVREQEPLPSQVILSLSQAEALVVEPKQAETTQDTPTEHLNESS